MPSPVVIGFATRGLADVQRSFGTLTDAMIRMERAGGQAAVRGAAERTAATKKEGVDRDKEFAKLAKEAEKWEREHVKAAEKAIAQRTKAEESALKQIVKAEEQAAKQRERVQETSFRKLERETEQHLRRETALIERETALQARATEAAQRKIASATGGALMRGTGRAFGTIASMAGSALAIGGGFAVANAVSGEFAAQRTAAQLVNAVTSTGAAPDGATVSNILKKASGVSVATGMDKKDVVEGTLAYSRAARGGDFKGAMGNMDFFARMSKVTGTSITDIGAAAGKLQSQNPDLDSKSMQQMLLNAYAQSKSGSVSFVDAAKQFGTLGSTRGFLAGDVGKNQMTLMGLGQIAASGGESGDMGTYIKDMVIQMAAHRKKTAKDAGFGGAGLESLGVKYTKDGQVQDISQAIGALFKASGGDMAKIHGVMENRGQVLFGELGGAFRKAGGGDKGVASVLETINGVTNSTMSAKDMDSQFKQVMSTPAERFGAAMNQVTEILQEKGAPYLERFAEKLPELIALFEKLVNAGGTVADWLLSNPIKGIGALIMASVAKDLGGMALGSLIKSAIEQSLAGGAAARGATTALGSATSAGGKVFGVLGAAGAGVAAGVVISDVLLDSQQSSRTGAISKSLTAGNLSQKQGPLTAAEIAERQNAIAGLEKEKANIGSTGGHLLAAALSPFSGSIQADLKADESARTKMLQESIDKLTAQIAASGGAAGKTGGTTNDPSRTLGMGSRGAPGGSTT